MPPVVGAALVAGVAAASGAAIAGTAIATAFLVAFGTSLITGGIAYALREEPDLPGQGALGAGLQISTLQPAQPRRILYGRNRVGGQIVVRAVTGNQNSAFHQIIVWAGHEVEAIESVYADDDTIPQTFASVTATDIFFEDLGDEIKSTTTDLEAAFPSSGMVFKVEGSVGQDGIYRIKNTLEQDTAPHELNVVRLDGDGSINNTTPGPSITLTETYARLSNHLGTASQAADATAVADIPQWTSAHKLAGCAYSYITLYYSQHHWKTGQPNHTAVIKGKKCLDPRDGTIKYTRNPALISADWLTDTTYGLGVPYANLNEASLIAAANVCDEAVITTAGSVARYTCDAVIKTNEDRRAVLQKLAASMAGYVVQTGAVWTFKAGAFETPTITLGESDLRGPVRITPKRSRQELFNSVKAGYRDVALDWQPTDMPHVQDAGALAQDNGEELWRTLRFDYTTDRETVTRLAKIALLRSREQATVELRVGLSALAITAADTIGLSIDRYSWSSKAFFVEQWGFAQYNDEHGEPALGVDLVLRETSADVFSWDAGEASPTPAPETLPTPDWATMDAPTGLTLASGSNVLLTAGDGTIISRIKVTWEMPSSTLAQRFEVRYKRSSDIEWAYLTAAAPTAWIVPVSDLDLYDVGVRAFNALGVPSDWVEQTDYEVVGKTEPPPNVTNLFVLVQADGTRKYTWDTGNQPIDVRGYEIRYVRGTTWTSWNAAQKLNNGVITTSPWESNLLPAGDYVIAIKAQDTSGNQSETETTLQVELGNPRLRSVLAQKIPSIEDWPGTITDAFVNEDNELEAISTGGWANLPDTWAELGDTWSSMGQTEDPIAYTTEVIDIGRDVKFTPLVTVDIEGTPTITMKTGTSADGGVTGSFVTTAPVTARYVQIKVSVTNPTSVAFIRYIEVLLDAPTVVVSYDDIDTSTEIADWFESVAAGHFKVATQSNMSVITSATIRAFQGVGAGWSFELISKSATVTGNVNPAAEFKTYNSSGTLADATIDIELKGSEA